MPRAMPNERILTSGPGGRLLTNCNVWSPDSQWIAYDTRRLSGDIFDGTRVEMIYADTGEVRVLYESSSDRAGCGVVTWHPHAPKVAFILAPRNWEYGPARRQGVIVDVHRPGVAELLDARDLVPPFTPGALRGGSHVHVWHPRGDWVSYTYEDHVLQDLGGAEPNRRNLAVAAPGRPVAVPKTHAQNHDGTHFCALVTACGKRDLPADYPLRACEEAWIGIDGYVRPDGCRQRRALAFQGDVQHSKGRTTREVFVADIPDDINTATRNIGWGTASTLPDPLAGVRVRRLTFTAGLGGPRHWLRSSPDGSRIGFLLDDNRGIAQFWTVNPADGRIEQITKEPQPVASAFTWHPDGEHVALVRGGAVHALHVPSGRWRALTGAAPGRSPIQAEACVVSPDGRRVAFLVRTLVGGVPTNQIAVADWSATATAL